MLITDKYPEYTKNTKLGISIKKITIVGIIVFIISLATTMTVLTITKDPFHFVWLVPMFLISGLFFDIPRRIKHPRCPQCGFKSDNETFDILPSDFFTLSGVIENETVVYDGSVYIRRRIHNTASKSDPARLVTQDYFICHTCHIYSPEFNKNYKDTSKNFDALKKLNLNKKKIKNKPRTKRCT